MESVNITARLQPLERAYPEIRPLPEPLEALDLVGLVAVLPGNAVHDLHTAVLMKEHGVEEIRTSDTDFHQFGFLRVVDPLVPGEDEGG